MAASTATTMSKIQERNIGIRESRRALRDALASLEEKHPEFATVFRHLFNWMNNRFLLLQDAVNHRVDERGADDVHPNVRPKAPIDLPSQPAATTKKRGRPPKNVEEADEPPAKKKRGRPPKNSVEGTTDVTGRTPAAKSRGRPPKNATPVTPSEATPTPKRRGRPPKKSLDGGAEVADDVATASPKKRGRPPKNAAASKSPVTTSPVKSHVKPPVKSPSGGTSTQKKRGRPRKPDTVAEKEVRASEQGGAEDDPETLIEMQKGKDALQEFFSSFG